MYELSIDSIFVFTERRQLDIEAQPNADKILQKNALEQSLELSNWATNCLKLDKRRKSTCQNTAKCAIQSNSCSLCTLQA